MILFISFASAASIGEFQLDVDDVEIYQTCNNCTYCNFTRLMGPNDQTILSNIEATSDGSYYYYSVGNGNFTTVGDYSYTYDCGNAAEKETGRISLKITYTGKELTEEVTDIYYAAILILIFFFIITLLLVNKLPSKDATDEDGVILQISNLKHLRPVLYGISWGIILSLMFVMANLTIAYLPTNMLGGLFWAIYNIMFWVTMVALPLWFIWIFTGIFRDREFKRMIERGVELKTL